MFKMHRHLSVLLLAGVVATATPACASSHGWSRYPTNRVVIEDRAYDIGYREGFEHGRDDARRARPYDYSRHGDYRDADQGYRGGNRNAYRRIYRDGFAAGYGDAYWQFARGSSRDGRWGGRDPEARRYPGSRDDRRFGSPAFDNGYRDGYEQGRDDARDGDAFDPRRAKRYREGDHDYNDRYGSRDVYKREYRDGFQRGYEQGHRESRRR
ncbi:MAG: hypothetical protein FJW27_18595 [Acidimicrobiia bacterium]|nr:hypothetical protein [Acidimicrobiia bacterium]